MHATSISAAATAAANRWTRRFATVFALVVLAGCAGLPADVPRSESRAMAASTRTALGAVAARADAHDGRSGFRLLPEGRVALDARFELIRRAEASLDVQYYLVGQDQVGERLLRELGAAAARGVRVRLLVDDLYTVGMDERLLGLASVPGAEVRVFNPFVAGRSSAAGRLLGALGELRRLNHRMHNKLLVADGAVAIFGGRNMADEYFQRHADANFLDVDALAVGPVVGELAESFDAFWNGALALPIAAVARAGAGAGPLPGDTDVRPDAGPDDAEADVFGHPPLGRDLDDGLPSLVWAPARVFADSPDKAGMRGRPEAFAGTVMQATVRSVQEARSEVTLVSPYFIPGARGLELIAEARRNGVAVRVVTNSLAATDEPLVGAAYRRYRVPLLAAGVELFELSPTRVKKVARLRDALGSSRGSLHAKLAFIDRRTLLLGSMNLDPRSAWINTEVGVRIDSPELVRRLAGLIETTGLEGAYQVALDETGEGLQWRAALGEREHEPLIREPEVGWLTRLRLRLVSPFVAESLL